MGERNMALCPLADTKPRRGSIRAMNEKVPYVLLPTLLSPTIFGTKVFESESNHVF